MLKAEYQTIKCERAASAEVRTSAEAALRTPEEVKKPISVSAAAFVTATEDRGETTHVKAQVAFRLVYLAEDGYKKCETQADIQAEIPLGNAAVIVKTEDARVTLSGDGYVARCSVTFVGEGTKTEEVKTVIGGDGLIVKETVISVDESVGRNFDEFTVSDEFETGYSISEVLAHGQSVRIKNVESGVSRVVVSGEVDVEVKALTAVGDDLVKERRNIPFRCEVACPGALPDMKARGGAEVRRAAYKVYADEAKNRSSIAVEIVLFTYGEAIGCKDVSVVTDAYSLTDEVKLTETAVRTERFTGEKYKEERIISSASGDAPEGGRLVGAFGETIGIISVDRNGGVTTVNGVVKADVAFRNADNGTSCVVAESPFSIEINDCDETRIKRVTLCDLAARVRNGGIEFEYVIGVRYGCYAAEETLCVTDAESAGERKKKTCAISVYIPKADDDLWDISKRLGLKEDDITALNPDLDFPLRGDERIVIYRQKV